jgi:ubiquitin-protein ligase
VTGQFVPLLFYLNFCPSDIVCLPILNKDEGWRLAIIITQMLLDFQDLLNDPNPFSLAQADAYYLLKKDLVAYEAKIKEIVKNNPAP